MYREFEMPSNRWRPLVVALAAVMLMLSMTLGRPPITGAVTSLASDAFGRTVATGWGNLDSGQAWLITTGNDASTDVNGSVGQMTHTVTSELKARVPTFNTVDVDISAKFRAETAADEAPTSNTEFSLYSRYDAEQASFCCYYKLTLSFVVGSASPVLRADKQNGSFTPGIGNATLPATNNDPTVAWMLKLETVGTAVRGKAWLASTSEPGAWQIDITDNSNPVTGVGQDNQFVVGTFTNDFTPSMVIDVDDVLATSAAGPPPDTTPPTVIARSPSANATGVAVSVNTTAQFSEAVTGVSTGTFAISNVSNFVNLAATVSYNAATRTATLNPSSPLSAGTKYRVGLSGGIKDLAGNPLAWTTWYFTTATSTTNYNPPALVTFKQGTHTGYKFSSTGAMTAFKTFTLGSNSAAFATTRKAITNQSGMWLVISSGVWSGYLVRESSTTYPTASPIGLPPGGNATFSPARLLSFKKGTHTGYQFSATGAMTAQKTYTLSGNSGAFTTARSTKTNQYGKWFLVSSGVWSGYWVLSSDVVFLTP